jgi:hypothetical protein
MSRAGSGGDSDFSCALVVGGQQRPQTPALNASSTVRADCIAGPGLLTRLLSEPLVKHRAREADVPAHPMAGQAAGPHGLVDPARPDVEIPSGLIRAKQPILLQRSLCCWCCRFHAGYRPQGARTGQRISPSNARPASPPGVPAGPTETPQYKPRRPRDDRWGTMQGTMPCRRNRVITSFALRLQVFWKWARLDSNQRPTDYESAALTN